jgi:predicted ATPase/DNA-binding winged helix-turn-helix (wHTH) protein
MNFGTFHFRQADRTLWRDSERVHMTAKARDLLACLVSANGRFVSKAEIMTAVWPDIHVLPDNIKVLIHEIRSVLEEDARNPHFIRSEAGIGYAFVPEGLTPDPPAARDRTHGLFLNRNRELAVLAEAFEDVRAGASRVVILNGERGIGKTAVCDVFLRLAAAGTPLRTIRAQCRETSGEPQPLLPLLDVVQRLEEPSSNREASEPEIPPAAWASVRAPARSPSPTVSALTQELRSMLASFAREMPLIVVLEDLQWADLATHRIVGQLARTETAGKWLVIATMGAGGLSDARAASLQRLMRATSRTRMLNLEPLTSAQVARYLDARFGPDRLSDLAASLHDVTGGNPSMLVAAIDGLIENGVLPAHADDPSPDFDIEAMINVLPYVLRDAMTRQIDRLDPDARALLEAASLVGGDVTATAVAPIAGTDASRVARVLASLAQRGCILRHAANGSMTSHGSDSAYRFQHTMYGHLLAERASVAQRFRATQRQARPKDRKARSE